MSGIAMVSMHTTAGYSRLWSVVPLYTIEEKFLCYVTLALCLFGDDDDDDDDDDDNICCA